MNRAMKYRGPTGKLKKGRRNDPLPNFSQTLFGSFGCLTTETIAHNHADCRWYGDGEHAWKNAPTAADAQAKAEKVVKRLQDSAYYSVKGASALALTIGSCSNFSRCGSHACPKCARCDQRWLVYALGQVIRRADSGFKDFTFNLVMPEGQADIADLGSVDFCATLEKCRRALDKCPEVKFAVLGIDISANDDTAKFKHGRLKRGLRIYFQVHVYGIVRTSDRSAVWSALRHLFRKSPNIFRPLRISRRPFDGANRGISYVAKPDGFRHVPYFDDLRREWNTPKRPPALKAREHVYYLLAMHELGFARRIAFVGLHPEITKATKTRSRGIRLRRVYRMGTPM